MTLIVFMLLVVIALAVGVRILEGGNKVALAVVLLVAAGLGVRLISQSVVLQADANAVLAAENDDQPATASDAAAEPSPASDDAEQADATPDAENVEPAEKVAAKDTPVEAVISDEPPAEIVLEDEDTEAEGADVAESKTRFAKSTAPNPVRPDWLDWDDIRARDADGIDMTAVSCDPHEHEGERKAELDKAMEQAVSDYVDEYLGRVYGGNFKASSVVNFDADYIQKNLVQETFDDNRTFWFGKMHQSHVLIAFTPKFRQVLDEHRVVADTHYRQFVVGGRLVGVGLIAGLILAFLAVISGYYRLDTATRGFYTARLQFLAAVAILAVIVAGALLAKNVHWM